MGAEGENAPPPVPASAARRGRTRGRKQSKHCLRHLARHAHAKVHLAGPAQVLGPHSPLLVEKVVQAEEHVLPLGAEERCRLRTRTATSTLPGNAPRRRASRPSLAPGPASALRSARTRGARAGTGPMAPETGVATPRVIPPSPVPSPGQGPLPHQRFLLLLLVPPPRLLVRLLPPRVLVVPREEALHELEKGQQSVPCAAVATTITTTTTRTRERGKGGRAGVRRLQSEAGPPRAAPAESRLSNSSRRASVDRCERPSRSRTPRAKSVKGRPPRGLLKMR